MTTKDGEEFDGKDAAGMEWEECRAGLSGGHSGIMYCADIQ